MIKKEKSDRSETIFNRFLMSKLVDRMIFDQFRTFSIFGLFFIKGPDEQEREVRPSLNRFQSIHHVKIGLWDDFRPIWNIFDFQTLLHQEPMIKKEKSDRSETIFNRFLMSKLVHLMTFDQFATFSIF